MEITFTGKSSKISKKEVREILNWAAEKLFDDKLSQNIKVSVAFRRKLEYNASGYCVPQDTDSRKYRVFNLEVNDSKARRHQIRTLFHEMVHIKQYAKGELRNDSRSVKLCRWMGEVLNENDFDYWDLPWEIEAYGREEGLYRKYLKHKKTLKNIKECAIV